MDLNTGFYKDLDTNFEQACYLSQKDFSHDELVKLLSDGNIPQKQIAALKFDKVENIVDTLALVNNLTGCDGKIREAIALKIFQLIQNPNAQMLFSQMEPKVFADATIDINANICRLIVDSVKFLACSSRFAKEYTDLILSYAKDALDELDRCVYRDKKYIKNKQLFKLYWCLETLKNFYKYADSQLLMNILKRSSLQEEYTIREKTAQIAIVSNEFAELQKTLESDQNYYVRAVFLNH